MDSGDRFRRRKRAISAIRSVMPPRTPPTMAPTLGPEEAAVVAEVEVEVELLLLPSFPSIWKMAESVRLENPFRGTVKLARPFPLFPNCQEQIKSCYIE